MIEVPLRARNEKATPPYAAVPKVQQRRSARVPIAILAPMAALATSATGCRVVEGIFKTGFWFGVIAVIAVIALLLFGIGKVIG